MAYFVIGLIFFAGVSSAVYISTWTRVFGLAMGNVPAVVVAAIAAPMAAVALGGGVSGRLVGRARRPLRVFGGLQIATGIYCAALPAAAPLAASLHHAVSGLEESWEAQALRIAVIFLFTCVPGALMGASLPVLSRHEVRERSVLSRSVGMLHAWAALGAASGTALTAFLLVPALGVAWSTSLAAVASLAAGVAALAVQRQRSEELGAAPSSPSGAGPEKIVVKVRPAGPSDETQTDLEAVSAPEVDEERPTESRLEPLGEDAQSVRSRDSVRTTEVTETQTDAAAIDAQVLSPPAAAATVAGVLLGGVAVMMLSVPLGRVLAMSMGMTWEALAIVASAGLFAAGLGAVLSSLRADRSGDAVAALAFVWLAMALAMFIVVPVAGIAAKLFARAAHGYSGDAGALRAAQFTVAFAICLPPLALWGASFPLALRAYSGLETHPGRIVGDLASTGRVGIFIGAAGGALLLGPSLGFKDMMNLAGGAAVVAGLLAAAFASSRGSRSFGAAVLVLVAAAAIAYGNQPEWNELALACGPLDASPGGPDGELVFHSEGGSAAVAVVRRARRTVLTIDGVPAADDLEDLEAQVLLAQLPLALREKTADVLLLGLGTGVTAGSLLRTPVAGLTIAEPRSAVWEALGDFVKSSGLTISDGRPADERVEAVVAGARSYLARTKGEFDLIVCRRPRPWALGGGDMVTEEAFEAAKRRLKPRGLFCLALRVDRMTEAGLLRTIRSFVDSFSLASMWEVCPGRECVLVGEMAAGPGEEMQNTLDLELVRSRMREPGASKELARVGISDEVDLLGLFFMPRSGLEAFSREVPRGVTDDNCGTEVRTARAIHSSLVADFNLNAYRHHVVKFVSGMPGDPAARTALAARFARVRSGRELALISRQFAAMGRPDRALAAARVAERVDARNYSARLIVDGERLSEGSVAFGAGQLSGALGRLEEFCPRNAAEAKLSARTRAKILAERARKRLEAGDAARALADSERSIGLAPHWPVIIMARARLLKELGRYTDAITVAESALRELTPSAGIVAFKAECYRLAGDPKQAAELLDTALVSEPANVALLVTRGKVYQDLGELADAVYCFDTAARQTAAPEFIRPLRGKALLELGRYREAVAELLAASAHFPGDGDIRLDLAKAYFYFGQQDLIEGYGDNGLEKMSKAEVNCVVAIDLGADEGRARLVLASIALKTDRLEEADIYLARARQVGAKPSERLMKAFEQGRKGRPTLEE